MTNELILAIDGGATRTRCLVIDRDGRVLGRGDAGPSNHLLIDHDSVRRSLSTAMDRALASAGLSKSAVRCAAAGLAGVDYDGAGADAARRLVDGVGPAVVAIEGDAVIAHLAALGGCPGVVALAGTGSNILGIAADGTRVKAGGWGPLYGNEGSAHGIARQALVAAARAYDGLGPRLPSSLQSSSDSGCASFAKRSRRFTAPVGESLRSPRSPRSWRTQQKAEMTWLAKSWCGRGPIWQKASPLSSIASGLSSSTDWCPTRAPYCSRVPPRARRSSAH
jgi:hypothetical protein